ncbi:hypothetical protein MUN78_10170 [Leucobacter allii]|uniref:DUF4352 domain-containing protein n=1 Tax=Leucobacter allii TaxID=2932247 RepID=A0ABY4FJE8_9MICO|nr:hypothetical protein [Leucobacter allii]UOQ56069.1 hypothetical protein MUN78_10170 [Leucobacter allii]
MSKETKALGVAAIALLFGLTACSSPVESKTPAEQAQEQATEVVEEPKEAPAPEPGTTRENPLPIGSKVSDSEWEVTINSANLDAGATLAGINQFNEAAPEGQVYVMVNASVTYLGDDPAGQVPFSTIDYVSGAGNTISQAFVDTGSDFTMLDPLYGGATHTGETAFLVPAPVDGVLAVTPGMMSDKMFVALQ